MEEEDVTILNLHVLNNIATKCIKLAELKGEIDKSTTLVRNLNILLSETENTSRPK